MIMQIFIDMIIRAFQKSSSLFQKSIPEAWGFFITFESDGMKIFGTHIVEVGEEGSVENLTILSIDLCLFIIFWWWLRHWRASLEPMNSAIFLWGWAFFLLFNDKESKWLFFIKKLMYIWCSWWVQWTVLFLFSPLLVLFSCSPWAT